MGVACRRSMWCWAVTATDSCQHTHWLRHIPTGQSEVWGRWAAPSSSPEENPQVPPSVGSVQRRPAVEVCSVTCIHCENFSNYKPVLTGAMFHPLPRVSGVSKSDDVLLSVAQCSIQYTLCTRWCFWVKPSFSVGAAVFLSVFRDLMRLIHFTRVLRLLTEQMWNNLIHSLRHHTFHTYREEEKGEIIPQSNSALLQFSHDMCANMKQFRK